jgi:thioredoxin reductase
MTNGRNHQVEEMDIAILGGGPAGLQAALVLSRTRKKIIVFDNPEPPRNAASHGVHNFLGLDGLLPIDIRKIAWKQIDKYYSAEYRQEKIVNVNKDVKTDRKLQTNVKGLYAVGDVQGSSPIGALAAAYDGGMAATSIVHEWYD